MIWATVSSRSCFCWLYRASPSSAAKNMINLVSVKCYLSLEDQLRSLLPLLPSPTSSPGTPGILHFPDCDSICVEFLQLPALGRGPVSSLLFLLLQGLQGTLQPPEHSLAKTWGVGLLLGHETTSFLKTQHNLCFPYGAGLDSILGLFMLSILSHLSNGLWTLCLVPMKTTAEG